MQGNLQEKKGQGVVRWPEGQSGKSLSNAGLGETLDHVKLFECRFDVCCCCRTVIWRENRMMDTLRELVVRPTVKLSTKIGFTNSAPLFEEKWNFGLPALIPHRQDPLSFHRSRAWSTLAAHDHPTQPI
jgi:hypothetical protein